MLIESKRMETLNEKIKSFHSNLKEAGSSASSELYLGKTSISCSQVSNFQIAVKAGDHTIKMDEPIESAGDNTAATPVQLFLAAFAGCMEITWLEICTMHKLNVSKISINITSTMDRRFVLAGKAPISPRLISLLIIFRFETTEKLDTLKKYLKKVEQFCPVGASLHPDIEKIYKFEAM
ncbi:hypothetical protein NEF87_004101 [Candidatus Lokiarchaeum ossiferum]|uniref:OsmC family peroxiredoxin n=1 Tax=Candidatus Lokiarchaeum ossiferum TaxID=2951803 RepID=A0ABY6HWB8_9ARCH|nr:hypothetical protein NEF87_004101 [Candidatus Lokiarchaeum sp. B-35]